MKLNSTPRSQKTFELLWKLQKVILDTLDFNDVVQRIVDSTVIELGYLKLGYEIVVLCLVNQRKQQLDRIAISHTDAAKKAISELKIPFPEIVIPLHTKNNLLIKAIETREAYTTTDWMEILHPAFTTEEARNLQRNLGIKTSLVVPIISSDQAIGTIIFSMSKPKEQISADEFDLLNGFSDVVSLAVQNATIHTKLQATSDKLQLANEKLHQLDSLKDEFVSIASHELRTPMGAIKSLVSMILEGDYGPISDSLREPLQDINVSVDRLVNLVNNMLNISRIEQGRMKFSFMDFDALALVEQVINSLEPLAKARGISLTFGQVETDSIQVDQDKLVQILDNLVGNALKFTDAGGAITVVMSKDVDKISVHVSDTGAGISEADQRTLFGKFKQISSQQKGKPAGSGLGLYISRELARKMGGDLWIEQSEPNKGSTFTVSFPISGTALAKQVKAAIDAESNPNSTITITQLPAESAK